MKKQYKILYIPTGLLSVESYMFKKDAKDQVKNIILLQNSFYRNKKLTKSMYEIVEIK